MLQLGPDLLRLQQSFGQSTAVAALQKLRIERNPCQQRNPAQPGQLLAAAGASEEIVTAALDFSVLAEVRNSINVFHDRRPELYRL